MLRRISDLTARFMYGRYGYDRLGYALLIAYLVLMLANTFAGSRLLGMLEWSAIAYLMFRVLSRNIGRRRAENERFEMLLIKVSPGFLRFGRRLRDIGTHRYRKCTNCGTVLRLPRRTGRHTAVCPRCRTEFDVKVII